MPVQLEQEIQIKILFLFWWLAIAHLLWSKWKLLCNEVLGELFEERVAQVGVHQEQFSYHVVSARATHGYHTVENELSEAWIAMVPAKVAMLCDKVL